MVPAGTAVELVAEELAALRARLGARKQAARPVAAAAVPEVPAARRAEGLAVVELAADTAEVPLVQVKGLPRTSLHSPVAASEVRLGDLSGTGTELPFRCRQTYQHYPYLQTQSGRSIVRH